MKSKEFHDFLMDAQRFNGDVGSRHLEHLAKMFAALPEKSVADVIKKLDGLHPPVASFLGTKLQVVREPIALLRNLMTGRAKASLLNDLRLLESLIDSHANAAVDAFVSAAMEALALTPAGSAKNKQPIRTDLVERYNRKLEEALGDDPGFQSIFNELVADTKISSAEVAALAKRFAHAAARSKEAAFKKIFARHQALMTSRAKSLATAGRIAG